MKSVDLGDPERSSVLFGTEDDVRTWVDAARARDFAIATVELARHPDKRSILEAFAAALRFPAWFGMNWDALGDSLADMSWWPAPGYTVVVRGLDDCRERCPREYTILLEILDEAAVSWTRTNVPFFVVCDARPSSATRT